MSIYIGVGGWVFEEWRDNFYPKGLSQKRELDMPAAISPPSKSMAPITVRRSRKASRAGMTRRRRVLSSP
jgi:hypothetical protein